MSEGPGGPQGATAGGTLAMRMLSQQAMVASQMKRAANDKAIAQMLAAKKSGPPAARLGDEIQHKSFLGALAGAVLGAIVTIAEGCLIMAACATGPYALVLVTSPSQDTMLLSTFYANGNFYNQCKNNVPQ